MKARTAAAGCNPTTAREPSRPPAKVSPKASRCKFTASRPVWSETLLEIPRTKRSRLRVELVSWDDDEESIVRFVQMMLGRNGVWIPSPHRTSLRMDELQRVAEVLEEVAP